ncbi:MAG TPA: DUF72 domain-containing protein [Methylomirabilota bacterium]|jgi:uncharacterized protein YecE (DUF72 family)|nr:DUF72 domain-containing protein [Methylomirabilota bacterium]
MIAKTCEGPVADLRVGTSGYAYPAWKGTFYPARLPAREMLAYYAARFPTVEINHTFYRMPSERTLREWAGQVPAGFQFAVKLNQKITHVQRLRDSEELLERFLSAVSVLAQSRQLGPILTQLPPSFRADLAALDEFLRLVPPLFRMAVEVRHRSWQTEEAYAVLRQHRVALCLAETDEEPVSTEGPAPDGATADFVYVRLRREAYASADLAAWRRRCDAWTAAGLDVYAYFKHEDAGRGPAYARELAGAG